MNFKKLCILGLAPTVAFSMTGCDGGTASTGRPTYGDMHTNPADVVAEIDFWHNMGAANQAILDSMISEFNKIYPNIKVSHSAQGGWEDLYSKVTTAINGGNEPNLAFAYPDHVASYLTQQVVVDLDQFIYSGNPDYAIDSEAQEDFIESAWEEGQVYNSYGTMFSFPYAKSTEVLYYNATLFEANNWDVPTTWDEMWALCETMKTTYPDKTPLGYDSESNLAITLLEQSGLGYTAAFGDENYLFNNQASEDLFTPLVNYYEKGYFTTSALNDDNHSSSEFIAQSFLMTVGSTGGASYNQPASDSLGNPVFDYGVATIPQVDVNNKKAIQQGPSLVMLNGTSMENEATWLFMQFITNTNNSAIYGASTGYAPVRYSSLETDIFKLFLQGEGDIKVDSVKTYINQLDAHFTSPAFNGSTKARQEIGFFIEDICLKKYSVKDALQNAYNALVK